MNELASQTIFISALLGGFCLTVLVLLLDNESTSKIMTSIFVVSIIAIGAFLISIFSMTNILLTTTEGYPMPINKADLTNARITGSICFFIGILSVLIITSLSGWTKSKKLGVFSTIVGVISLVLIVRMMG